MLDWLTLAVDKDARAYAKYLDADNGEDAYHNTIESLIRNRHFTAPTNSAGFLRTAIRRSVYKFWRHEQSMQAIAAGYTAGEGPHATLSLKQGRLSHTHCRRGHEFTPDNIVYVGKNHTGRTCKQCAQTRRKNHVDKESVPSSGQSHYQSI